MIEYKKYQWIKDNMPIPCVDLLVVNNAGAYFLVKRKNHPLKNKWWIPGGRVLKNETLQNAAHRKAKEELGFDVNVLSCVGYYEDFYKVPKNKVVHTISIVFVVSPVENFKIKLDSQSSDWKWSKELPDEFNLKSFINI